MNNWLQKYYFEGPRLTRNISQTLLVADDYGWKFKYVAEGPMLDEPVFKDDWWFIPTADPYDEVPEEAQERIDALREARIPIQGYVVGHEARYHRPPELQELRYKLLNPPPEPEPEIDWGKVIRGAGRLAVKTGDAIGQVLAAAASLPLLVIDPVLMVVVDNTYIEIFRWDQSLE